MAQSKRAMGPIVALDIALEQIFIGKNNPRKFFDERYLAELADSIKEKGVLQPITVRPASGWTVEEGKRSGKPGFFVANPKLEILLDFCTRRQDAEARLPQYELVAGECRYRASLLASRKTIPAIIRELDDRAAREIQVIENLQRRDLSEIEEAEGYNALLTGAFGYTVETLAQKIGKSPNYVYGRLRLAYLPEAAKQDVLTGKLEVSKAELIAQVARANRKLAEQFHSEIMQNCKFGGEPSSLRECRSRLESKYMVQLKGAKFSTKDARLLPGAGDCTTCPKRSGNQPDNSGRADMCLDPECYRKKELAEVERLKERERAAGLEVLAASVAKKLFHPWGWSPPLKSDSGFVDFDALCPEDKKRRSYRQLLETWTKPVVAFDPQGKAHYLVAEEEANRLLKRHHKITRKKTEKAVSTGQKQADREARRKRREQMTEVILPVEQQARKITVSHVLRQLAVSYLSDYFYDLEALDRIRKRYGLTSGQHNTPEGICKLLDQLSDEHLAPFLVELLAITEFKDWTSEWDADELNTPFLLLCGINLKEQEASFAN